MKFMVFFGKLALVISLAATAAVFPSSSACADGHYEVSLNSLVFVETDIQKVLEIFSKMTGCNLFLDEGVPRKKVTFFAQNMQIRLALEMFVRTNGLAMKKMNANTFLIYPKSKTAEYESEVASHVFILENDDPRKIINILKTIGKNTKVSLNERINGIVMIDTPENIETAKKIVASMDYKKPQVTVDLKLVEVKRDRLQDLGVKFKQDSNMIVDLRSLARLKDQVVIDTLIKENAAEVLAQPQLKVLDQQKAEIQVGDKIPIEITSASKTAAGDSVQLNKTVQWESVGIKLQIQVEKIHNDNEVTLKIYNEVSSVVEYTKEGYPHIRTRNAVTVVRLNSNETAVIGGLINSEERTTVFKIPLLSKLPGLGKIFRNVKTDKISTEIIMFITPTISSATESIGGMEAAQSELLAKAETRSAGVTSDTLGIMDRNTDYYSETFPKLPAAAPASLTAIHTPETLETALQALNSLKSQAAATTESSTAPPADADANPSVKTPYDAPKTAATTTTTASPLHPAAEPASRSDYNEKLKQILNRIRASRNPDERQTAPLSLENR